MGVLISAHPLHDLQRAFLLYSTYLVVPEYNSSSVALRDGEKGETLRAERERGGRGGGGEGRHDLLKRDTDSFCSLSPSPSNYREDGCQR